jgi:hypothetical protein
MEVQVGQVSVYLNVSGRSEAGSGDAWAGGHDHPQPRHARLERRHGLDAPLDQSTADGRPACRDNADALIRRVAQSLAQGGAIL